MIIAALASFAALLVAWVVAPSEPVRQADATAPAELRTPAAEPMADPVAEAA
jgi:hypothetical protein